MFVPTLCEQLCMFYKRVPLLSRVITISVKYLVKHALTCLLTYLITPWNKVLFEKLTIFQLVKKFLAFYGTPRLITAVTSVRYLSLTWASSIQSIPPHPTSWKSIMKEPPLPKECTIAAGIRPTWEWRGKNPIPNIFFNLRIFRGKGGYWNEEGQI